MKVEHMNISAEEIDMLLDIVSTHLVRYEDGQDLAQDLTLPEVDLLFERLTEEYEDREALAIADAVGEGEPILVDPFSQPGGEV